ncbi:MAG: histidine kinase [Saprospiraceae bacterium]|nr:histidine kinase [Saprospiraceae bacterium]
MIYNYLYRVTNYRLARHLLFWLLYLTWQAYAEYLYSFSAETSLALMQKIAASFIVESLLLPVKLGLCYATAYLIRKSLSEGERRTRIWKTVLLIILLVLLSILAHRWLSNYVAYPAALGAFVDIPFWGPSYLANSTIDMMTVFGLFNVLNFFELRSVMVRDREIARREKLEAEIHFLRSQINPHFLFNTLNNIYVLAKNHPKQAPDAIHKLAGLLRFLLYESTRDLISIDHELEFIKDYLELEKLRYKPEKLALYTTFPESSRQSIAPMLILPLVENAFKHGISESQHQSFVNLKVILNESHLEVFVQNSYETMENAKNAGIGLVNLRKRLKLLYREYHLHFTDENQVYSALLKINLSSYDPTLMPHPGR